MKHSVARIAQQSRRVGGWLRGRRGERERGVREKEKVTTRDEREGKREKRRVERNGSDSWRCNCTFKVAFPGYFAVRNLTRGFQVRDAATLLYPRRSATAGRATASDFRLRDSLRNAILDETFDSAGENKRARGRSGEKPAAAARNGTHPPVHAEQ